jgi:hypothetical protein
MYICGVNKLMIMMKNIENKGITATLALKNEVAGKTNPLFGQAKRRIQPERYAKWVLNFWEIMKFGFADNLFCKIFWRNSMKKIIMAFVVLSVLASCRDQILLPIYDIQYTNVKRLIINGLSEDDDMKIKIGYDNAGNYKKEKFKEYTESCEDSFQNGIDIYYLGVEPYLNPPQYKIPSTFENNILTITVQKVED